MKTGKTKDTPCSCPSLIFYFPTNNHNKLCHISPSSCSSAPTVTTGVKTPTGYSSTLYPSIPCNSRWSAAHCARTSSATRSTCSSTSHTCTAWLQTASTNYSWLYVETLHNFTKCCQKKLFRVQTTSHIQMTISLMLCWLLVRKMLRKCLICF